MSEFVLPPPFENPYDEPLPGPSWESDPPMTPRSFDGESETELVVLSDGDDGDDTTPLVGRTRRDPLHLAPAEELERMWHDFACGHSARPDGWSPKPCRVLNILLWLSHPVCMVPGPSSAPSHGRDRSGVSHSPGRPGLCSSFSRGWSEGLLHCGTGGGATCDFSPLCPGGLTNPP